jgi:hypothetical protein
MGKVLALMTVAAFVTIFLLALFALFLFAARLFKDNTDARKYRELLDEYHKSKQHKSTVVASTTGEPAPEGPGWQVEFQVGKTRGTSIVPGGSEGEAVAYAYRTMKFDRILSIRQID